jgi:hypothetical protein
MRNIKIWKEIPNKQTSIEEILKIKISGLVNEFYTFKFFSKKMGMESSI